MLVLGMLPPSIEEEAKTAAAVVCEEYGAMLACPQTAAEAALLGTLASIQRAGGGAAEPAARDLDDDLEPHLLLTRILLDDLKASGQDASLFIRLRQHWRHPS